MRSIIPHMLGMSVFSLGDQSPSALTELGELLDWDLEYVGYNLNE